MRHERVMLDVVRRVVCQRLTELGLPNVEANVYHDPQMHHLVVSLEQRLLAGFERDRVDVEERWPADWWEAFKERWFPRWALKRWPVRYNGVSVHREFITKVCPHVAIPDNRRHLEFLMMNDPPSLRGFGYDDERYAAR